MNLQIIWKILIKRSKIYVSKILTWGAGFNHCRFEKLMKISMNITLRNMLNFIDLPVLKQLGFRHGGSQNWR